MERFRFVISYKFMNLIASLVLLTGLVSPMGTVLASHDEASLQYSNFEIDTDANIHQDDASPSIDWATGSILLDRIVFTDTASGKNDDALGKGSKEDDEHPTKVLGSIPPNKSDLKEFGVYIEENVHPFGAQTSPGFLNLFWSRVQDPSGTTNMDFELNQNKCVLVGGTPTPDSNCSENEFTPARTVGDLLITYDLSKGGTHPVLSLRIWNGTVWGPATDLSASNQASGSINDPSSIPAETGLGPYSPRTFGEAQVDLGVIFNENSCKSFGSAYLKSRSSDSFTSELKDIIAPHPIDLTNCGKVIIRKETNPDEDPNSTEFGFTKSFPTDPDTDATFTLTDDDSITFQNVLLNSGYSVSEDVIADGYAFNSVDCSASVGVTPQINGATVTFDLDADDDVLDCTYYNDLQVGAILIHKDYKHAASGPGDHPQSGVDFLISGGNLADDITVTTDGDGNACVENLVISAYVGDYTVTEVVPTGYKAEKLSEDVTISSTGSCDDLTEPTVTFKNTPLTNLSVTVDSQVAGGTSSTIECVLENTTVGSAGPGDDIQANLEDLEPGTYVCTIVVDP